MAPAQMGKQEALKQFTIDWTDRARKGELDPIVGRDDESRAVHAAHAGNHRFDEVLVAGHIDDAHLHVVDEQRHLVRVNGVLERSWDPEAGHGERLSNSRAAIAPARGSDRARR